MCDEEAHAGDESFLVGVGVGDEETLGQGELAAVEGGD